METGAYVLRKALIIFSLVIFSISVIYASDVVTGSGSGSDPEVALSNARADLASRFSVNISSLILSSVSDDGENSTANLSSMSLQTTSFKLLGANETTVQNEDGSFSATSSLSEAQVPLYEAQLNNLFTTINELLPYVDPSGDFDVQKNVYPRLISALREYEIYQIVVLRLSPDSDIGKRVLPVTRAVIENEYQSRLTLEENETEIIVSSLTKQAQMGILHGNDEILTEASDRLEEIRKQQEQMRRLAADDMALMLEKFGIDDVHTADNEKIFPESSDMTSGDEPDNSFENLINSIEADRATIQAIRDNANEWLRSLEESFQNEINSIVSSEYNSPREVQQETERTRRDFQQQANSFYLEAFNMMSDIATHSLGLADELSSRTFTASSNDSCLSAYIEGYFDNARLYSGIADITIGNESIRLYFRIPYESWTGFEIPSESDHEAYLAYESDAGYWLEILQDYPSIYTLEVDFSVSTDYSPSYEVRFSQFRIIRNDTGEQVFSWKIDQTDDLRYESRTELTDFSVTYDDLLDTSLFVFDPYKNRTVSAEENNSGAVGNEPEDSDDMGVTEAKFIYETRVYENEINENPADIKTSPGENVGMDNSGVLEHIEKQERKTADLSIIGDAEIAVGIVGDEIRFGVRLSLLASLNSRLKAGGLLEGVFFGNEASLYIGVAASWLMTHGQCYWYLNAAAGPGIFFSYDGRVLFDINGSFGVSVHYPVGEKTDMRFSLQFAKSGCYSGLMLAAGVVYNLGGNR